MQEDILATSSSLVLSQETLRAFAKGKLDEATERKVLAVLETRPDLAAKIAAISSDSVLEKMKSQAALSGQKSLSSQLSSAGQAQQHENPAAGELEAPAGLSELTDYKIFKEIGRGGMGVVYLAEHLIFGRKEVLKVLNERLMTSPEARKRFDQEIKCIAAMNHETIVRCYAVQQLPSAIVLCMEYVPGTNLHQFIHTNGPLPIHVACGIAAEVCRGLQHAMDNGLVHRDIKPSNIMLYKADGKIKAKILDFGLARLNTRENSKGLTDDGTLLGTLEYIAPEQCLNAAAADIRSDIYSLGCTLYHMLVGHPPFSGSSGELVLAHSTKIPPAVNLIQQHVPQELAHIVAKMLAKDPAKRYPTPLSAAKELKAFSKKPEKTNSGQRLFKSEPSAYPQIATSQQAEIDTSVERNTVTARPENIPPLPINPDQQSNSRSSSAPDISHVLVTDEVRPSGRTKQGETRYVSIRAKFLIGLGILIPLLLVTIVSAILFINSGTDSNTSIVDDIGNTEEPDTLAQNDVPPTSPVEKENPRSAREDLVGTWHLTFGSSTIPTLIVKLESDGTSVASDDGGNHYRTWGTWRQLSPDEYIYKMNDGSIWIFRHDGKILTGKHSSGKGEFTARRPKQ